MLMVLVGDFWRHETDGRRLSSWFLSPKMFGWIKSSTGLLIGVNCPFKTFSSLVFWLFQADVLSSPLSEKTWRDKQQQVVTETGDTVLCQQPNMEECTTLSLGSLQPIKKWGHFQHNPWLMCLWRPGGDTVPSLTHTTLRAGAYRPRRGSNQVLHHLLTSTVTMNHLHTTRPPLHSDFFSGRL